MGGGSKSPTKKATVSPAKRGPAKPRAVPATCKRIKSKAMIDDEASEEEGVLVDRGTDSGEEMDGLEGGDVGDAEFDRYEADFINDGDPFEGRSEDSDTSFPEVLLPPPNTPPRRNVDRRGKPTPVIDIESSSEEDMTAMDIDDSMFRKPTGLKASALPPSLITRSASAKRGATSQSAADNDAAKKAKLSASASVGRSSTALPVPEQLPGGGFGSQADMMKYVAWPYAFWSPNSDAIVTVIDDDPDVHFQLEDATLKSVYCGGGTHAKNHE
ncbi:hypothetical protein MVEN_02564100 [Mycena venus]|uniref:Uncharacterized protein n=1 Tax=Mycena venus TaxID=2733690 RepID=A0A8H6U3L9_9AGAR|nr:hypothetical protein MVEN_02564100 [Mycena venus]